MKNKVKINPETEGHNQCPSCGKEFYSLASFDKHHTGPYGKGQRRCLTTEEMLVAGMAVGRWNRWITEKNPTADWVKAKIKRI